MNELRSPEYARTINTFTGMNKFSSNALRLMGFGIIATAPFNSGSVGNGIVQLFFGGVVYGTGKYVAKRVDDVKEFLDEVDEYATTQATLDDQR